MKKRIVTLLFCILLSTFAIGCGEKGENKDSQVNNDDSSISSDDDTNLDSLGDIEVDEGLFDVELTIPADFADGATQEDLDKTANEKGYKSATLNSDGSVTYVMTKAQHKKMMDEMAEEINAELQGLVGSEDYPNFTKVEANSDYTKFTISTTSTELDLAESFSVINFYMQGGLYNIFNGTPVDNIHVDFVNAESGEIISSSDSSDMGE